MKILTVCHAGAVRSVAMAYVLKHYGHDALAISAQWNSESTIEMLCNWADRILVMDTEYLKFVPFKFHNKTTDVKIGKDFWINSMHKDLLETCQKLVFKLGLENDGKWRKSGNHIVGELRPD